MSVSIEDLLQRIDVARPDPIPLRSDEVQLLSVWLETTRPTLKELAHGDRDHLRFVLEFNRRRNLVDESATDRTGSPANDGPTEAEIEVVRMAIHATSRVATRSALQAKIREQRGGIGMNHGKLGKVLDVLRERGEYAAPKRRGK